MTPNEKAKELGIRMEDYKAPPIEGLAPATRVGNTIYTSGHVSMGYQGKVGQDLTIDEAIEAARICAIQVLQAAHTISGSFDNLRCVKLMGFVNAAPDFSDAHLVINGASNLIWDVYGKQPHARSALGMGPLPLNFAVEVEGIFEILED